MSRRFLTCVSLQFSHCLVFNPKVTDISEFCGSVYGSILFTFIHGFFQALIHHFFKNLTRSLEDGDLSPPCMSDAFRCLGKIARAALCAISRHLRLRSE